MDPNPDLFPPHVAKQLQIYVYRLIDPRNGETFYVGKGHGNRVFAHIREELHHDGDEIDNKLKRIREIHLAGLEQTLLNPSPLPPQVQVPSPLLVQLLLAIRQLHDRGVAAAALHERETAARRSTQQLWASGLLLAAVLTATLTFSNETVIPDTDGSLYREHATWWGFVRQSQELRWKKSDEYSDEPMWMLRRPDGRWKPYQMMTPFHELEESSIGAR